MSDDPDDDIHEKLDLRAEIVRIDLDIAETHKFQAEQRKLIAESRKLDRDRWLAPLVLPASVNSPFRQSYAT